MMREDDSPDFNFWPSFADMMLALVLVLVLCLALFMASAFEEGTVDLSAVARKQTRMIDSIAKEYSVEAKKLGAERYGLFIASREEPDIVFQNDLSRQRITFSEQILFDRGRAELKPEGELALIRVGARLKEQIDDIQEIQIEGHADTDRPVYYSNLLLAARRSITVFEVMQQNVGIHPAQHRMSATSFGEYMSVERSEARSDYNENMLAADNSDDDKKRRNRRIELVVIYRR
jgi:flagellar motor protein MotB